MNLLNTLLRGGGQAGLIVCIGLTVLSRSIPQAEGQESRASKPLDPELFQESEEVLSDDERWRQPGFRLGLGYYQSSVTGIQTTPSGLSQGVEVDLGVRLDEEWSLGGALRYGVGSEALSGLLFSGMLTSAYHWRGLSAGLGVGVRGYIEQRNGRADPHQKLASQVVASYTLPEGLEPLARCIGFGPLTGVTLRYHWPLSQITSLSVGARADISRVGCELETDRVEPDTAQGIYLRQYWTSWTWSWVGGLSWR